MEELLKDLIIYVGEDYTPEQEAFLRLLINDAIEEVCGVMYPFGFNNEEKAKESALKRYKGKIRKIAQYYYDKQGVEGVTSYSGNGESRSYSGAGTPSESFSGIVPVAKRV